MRGRGGRHSEACLVVVLMGLAAAATGCKDSTKKKPAAVADELVPVAPVRQAYEAEQVIIDDVVLRVSDDSPGYELYPKQLAQHVGRQLAESGYFFALPNQADPMRPSRRARISVSVDYSRVPEGSAGKPSLLAAVEATVTWVDGSTPFLKENLLGERITESVPEAELALVAAAHVARIVEEACVGLIAQERLRTGPSRQIVETLGGQGTSPNLLRFALKQLAPRRIAGAVELAARHLGSKHPEVRHVAVSTLVELGDPAGVDALTKAASFDDHESMRVVVEAVAVLGGQDAIDYLDFVASGHPDD